MAFANSAIIKCPHCENNNVKPPLGDRWEWYCPRCMKMFNKPLKKSLSGDKLLSTPICKPIEPMKSKIFPKQVEKSHGGILRDIAQKLAQQQKHGLIDEQRARIELLAALNTRRQHDPKNKPRHRNKKARELGSQGLCPQCGSGWIRRPMPKKTNLINQLYRTHYHCRQCGAIFKRSVKSWDPDAPLVESTIEPPEPILGGDIHKVVSSPRHIEDRVALFDKAAKCRLQARERKWQKKYEAAKWRWQRKFGSKTME
jgi:hypothetical protein